MKSLENKFVLVLDVGTTGIKAFVFSRGGDIVAKANRTIGEIRLHPGHVEQDPAEIIQLSKEVLAEAVSASKIKEEDFLGMSITNQRETIIAWDKKTAWPFYPAIVWKDTRTNEYCQELAKKFGEVVLQKTGLPILPYFSASKISWLLDNVPEVKLAAEKNCLACGTVDSWLLWNLTEEQVFSTDVTNATRTLLCNIKTKQWDDELLNMFNVNIEILPEIKKTQGHFGNLKKDILGFSLPILTVCGDQQASLYAAGDTEGTTKITYGTGTFIMQIIGKEFLLREGFFTTITAGGENFAIEAKMDRGAKEVLKLLADKPALKKYLKEIAIDVDKVIKKLPHKPTEIVIDGGVMRDGIVGKFQEEISGIKIVPQKIFDGTALGAAKLVFDQ
ncbi:MAG: FGGY family carbohydrate kinase [bacterium]|nr:FGGY family carbohydrate kinase [bacterium]